MEGLAAEGALGSTRGTSALTFLADAQDSDGGWGYDPNSASAPGSTDPDSTALVIQAILAAGGAPSSPRFRKGNATPESALMAFQLTSGSGAGAFYFPGSESPDLLATYQAIPAVAGTVIPFAATTTTAGVDPATVEAGRSVTYSATVAASSGTPRGSVTFSVGSTVVCSAPLTAARGDCKATDAPVGADETVTATYTGGPAAGLSGGVHHLDGGPRPGGRRAVADRRRRSTNERADPLGPCRTRPPRGAG